jgi:hypothetical protein
MLSDDAGQPPDGVGIDADQASGGADAATLIEMPEHRESLLLGEMAVEEDRALAFGEAVPARLAVEQSDVVLLAVTGADREVAGVTRAVEGTVGSLATEACEVVHAGDRSERRKSDGVRGYKPDMADILRCSPVQCSVIFRHDRMVAR